ncbi:DUF6603 domain-containing protein [Streptomyces sp. NPDC048340]|uniref:DUF6603 domain-containing protein n=1 Tax=Streptomyces sp. NPDC048340 TaxID=3365537 RepID=UPI00371125C9
MPETTDRDGKDGKALVLLVSAPLSMGLQDLPIIGPQIGPGKVEMSDVSVVATSSKLTVHQVDRINGLVKNLSAHTLMQEQYRGDGRVPQLPSDSEVPSGVSWGASLTLAGRTHRLLAPGSTRGGGKKPLVVVGVPSGPPKPFTPAGQAKWIDVGKTFGPLRVRRLGLATGGQSLWLLTDAALSAGPVTLDAMGLGVGVSLDGSWRIEGALAGLGLAYAAGPVEMSGAFLNRKPPDGYRLMLAGGVTVKTPQISLGAVGFYAERLSGSISLYVFGEVSGLKLTPPPLEVTGLAGGFGYNSRINIPAVQDVARFPLVAGLTNRDRFPLKEGPTKVLEALGTAISPAAGSIWLAAGVQLTAFEFIEGRALAVLQLGEDVTLAMLGLITARFPKPQGSSTPTYAKVSLQVAAAYRISLGELVYGGALTRDSFLLHEDCRLQGQFAYQAWLPPSRYAGDFVATFGGYHPDFTRPVHYPAVARIGFSWKLKSWVHVKGEAYAALTPAAFMIGASVHVSVDAKLVDAWLDASVDALIRWDPFAFRLKADIRAGVRGKGWFRRLRGHFGARLELWGPPSGGIVQVWLPKLIPDIKVRFGADPPRGNAYLTWRKFRDTSLGDSPVRAVPTAGLVTETGAGPKSVAPGAPWPVGRSGLAFTTQSVLPITRVFLNSREMTRSLARMDVADGARPALKPVDLRLVGEKGWSVTHRITVTDAEGLPVKTTGWEVRPVAANMPSALWGKPLRHPPHTPEGKAEVLEAEPLVPNRVAGVRVTVPPPKPAGTRLVCSASCISSKQQDAPAVPVGKQVLTPVRKSGSRAAVVAGTARHDLRQQSFAALRKLGIAPPCAVGDHRLPDFATRPYSYLSDDPFLAVPAARATRQGAR